MTLVLDSGGLIAFERGDREVAALVEAARRRREKVVTSSGCVAQVWRRGGSGQALLARLLRGTDERPLDHHVSRAVGELCAGSASSDVVDAHVALLAQDHDVVVTSDADELESLLTAARSSARVRRC
ncbi:MAG TPA: hypothetical protein VM942_10465 [Acidimicrobiales bacterium]|nr:hypothetical protein [Acidimicrobiales bacterium]